MTSHAMEGHEEIIERARSVVTVMENEGADPDRLGKALAQLDQAVSDHAFMKRAVDAVVSPIDYATARAQAQAVDADAEGKEEVAKEFQAAAAALQKLADQKFDVQQPEKDLAEFMLNKMMAASTMITKQVNAIRKLAATMWFETDFFTLAKRLATAQGWEGDTPTPSKDLFKGISHPDLHRIRRLILSEVDGNDSAATKVLYGDWLKAVVEALKADGLPEKTKVELSPLEA